MLSASISLSSVLNFPAAVGRIRRQFPPQQLDAAQRLHRYIDHAEVGAAAVQMAEHVIPL